MATDRRFARFNPGKSTVTGQRDASPVTTRELPQGGMCLSSFVLLTEVGHPNRVLLGHLNPEARWDHIGALDAGRVAVHSKGWMIPSCHLMIKESPLDAARRVVKEQLELGEIHLSEPRVFSEVYTPRGFPELPSHWDLQFVFRGELPGTVVPRATAWRELAMVDTTKTRKSEMARSHEDVLESAGFRFAEDSAAV